MKVIISAPKDGNPQAQHEVIGEIDSDDVQCADRVGIVSGPSMVKLVTLLGDAYGTRVFRMQIGDVILSGCRVVRHAANLTFRY